MSGDGFIRIKKLTSATKLLPAARHNRRAIAAELDGTSHIDPAQTCLNFTLKGPATADDVKLMADDLMKAAGVGTLRRDAVRAIEIVYSLPAGSEINHRGYFQACLDWTASEFGGATNILSADVHLDEGAPHCHVLVLPLINGRMVGSDLVGGGSAFNARRVRFFDAVARVHGLARPPARLSGKAKREVSAAVLQALRAKGDPALHSSVWATIRDAVEKDPRVWAEAVGVTVPDSRRKEAKRRTMTQIFTSPGRGLKRASVGRESI